MIPVLTPHVPTLSELYPYLQRIDASRWYTNRGPLVRELEARLSKMYGAHVATVASGTAGLELALALQGFREVRIAAYGFRATMTAATRSGVLTHFVDVDPNTWMMNPVPQAIMTCAYGAPYKESFMSAIVDAASASGNQGALDCPVVFSMHATKLIPAGEGGYVVTRDERFANEIRRLANFGFEFYSSEVPERERQAPGIGVRDGTNAKLSEYHAAVAHASLDRFGETCARLDQLRTWYEDALPARVQAQAWVSKMPVVTTTLNVKLPMSAGPVQDALMREGIASRRWYECLHPSPVARELYDRVIGLPYWIGMEKSAVQYVCAALDHVLTELEGKS